jgi:hypothetical protein
MALPVFGCDINQIEIVVVAFILDYGSCTVCGVG